MKSAPRVSAIVVSYQVRDLLRRCLATLTSQRGVIVDVQVVDNASDDGSADMVAREFPSVTLIRSETNLGFARANNLALAAAGGDFLALVNPDTELPPDALVSAIRVFRRHPDAGVVGLSLAFPDGSLQPNCHRFPGLLNQCIEALGLNGLALRAGIGTPTAAPVPRGGEGEVDWVAGAFMILSRPAYSAVGGLDASSFMYGEEMDWSWRARQNGYRTVFSSAAVVLHHGGASGGGLRGELQVHLIEARLAFLRRYRGVWRSVLSREILTLGALARVVAWRLRAAVERLAGGRRARTHDRIQRFEAVIRWRFARGA